MRYVHLVEQSSQYRPSPSAIQSHKTSAKSLPQTWHLKHLKAIAHKIPPINETAKIHLLPLGWTISGQMCLDFASGPAHVLTHLTSLSTVMEKEPETGRRIYELIPCPNQIKVTAPLLECATDDIFRKTRGDEPGLSCEDRKFLEKLDRGIHKNSRGNWEMPLSFCNKCQTMPHNRVQAMQRLQGLLKTFARKPKMKADYLEFIGKIIDKGHALAISSKEVPPSPVRSWYLPHFSTYHNTKHTIRVVFDSSCEFEGVLLNKVLLPGPDLMNNLIGVLMRFRKENIAVMCDIKQMFHSFYVDPPHGDFLCFLWFEGNDP